MCGSSMFEKKNSLPGAEQHLSIDDWDDFARARENHSNMGRHIVAPFIVVLKIRRIFRHEAIEESLEIAARFRRGIFHDNKTATGVTRKNGRGAVLDSAFIHHLSNLVGNFVGPFTVSRNVKTFYVHSHS